MTEASTNSFGDYPHPAVNFIGPLEDRMAIRDLHDSYGDAITRRDEHLWASCWARDGVYQPADQIYRGRDCILEQWISMMKYSVGSKGSLSRLFTSHPGGIILSGDTGHGWTYTDELLVDQENMTFHLNGLYSDRYVREDGRWVFQERLFKKLHIDHPY